MSLKPSNRFGLLDTGATGTFPSEALFSKIPMAETYVYAKKKTFLTMASDVRKLIGVKMAKIPLTLIYENDNKHIQKWIFTICEIKSNDLYFGCEFVLDSIYQPSIYKNHLTLTLIGTKQTQIKMSIFRLPIGKQIHLFSSSQFTIPQSVSEISRLSHLYLTFHCHEGSLTKPKQ